MWGADTSTYQSAALVTRHSAATTGADINANGAIFVS
jgi:hypothetical protein